MSGNSSPGKTRDGIRILVPKVKPGKFSHKTARMAVHSLKNGRVMAFAVDPGTGQKLALYEEDLVSLKGVTPLVPTGKLKLSSKGKKKLGALKRKSALKQ